MATHGTLYLPLNPNDPKSPMLHCEAYSNGYLSGLGYGALCSSTEIDTICKLSNLFSGGLVFHDPKDNQFDVATADYMGDFFYEAKQNKDPATQEVIHLEYEALKEALLAVKEGRIDEALSGDYSKISLEHKLARGYCYYNQPETMFLADEAIKEFMSSYPDDFKAHQETLTDTQLAEHMARGVKAGHQLVEDSHTYFWHAGQFWGCFTFEVDGDEDDGEASLKSEEQQHSPSDRPEPLFTDYFVAPLIMMAALSEDGTEGTYSDVADYLPVMTPKDQASLQALITAFEQHDLPLTQLFDGAEVVQVLIEQQSLTTAVSEVPLHTSSTVKAKSNSL